MKKATMVAAGILTAASVAGALGVVMSSSAKRVAKNTAEAVEKTGKKMRRMVQNMKGSTTEQTPRGGCDAAAFWD